MLPSPTTAPGTLMCSYPRREGRSKLLLYSTLPANVLMGHQRISARALAWRSSRSNYLIAGLLDRSAEGPNCLPLRERHAPMTSLRSRACLLIGVARTELLPNPQTELSPNKRVYTADYKMAMWGWFGTLGGAQHKIPTSSRKDARL